MDSLESLSEAGLLPASRLAGPDGGDTWHPPSRPRPAPRGSVFLLASLIFLYAVPASADWHETWGAMIWGVPALPAVPSLRPGSLIILAVLMMIAALTTRPWKRFNASSVTPNAVQQPLSSHARLGDADGELQQLRTEIKGLRVKISELERAGAPKWRKLLSCLSSSPRARCMLMAALIAVPAVSYGGAIALPHIFVNGTPADAEQVNENFAALVDESNTQSTRIDESESAIAALNSAIATLSGQDRIQTSILNNYLSKFSGVTRIGSNLVFTGMNLQVVDGTNSTDGSSNGLGNLVIGYNENTVSAERTGSHNLVLGVNNDYNSFGGLVSGEENTLSAPFATISGGISNEASGSHSTVVGGEGNLAEEFGETQLGDSPGQRLLDVTNPPAACAACTAAVGDGVAGDSQAVNEAIVHACDNGYDGIFLPAGSYRLGSTDADHFYSGAMIEASTCPNGLAIVGAGSDQTTLLPASPTGQYLIASCDDFNVGRYGGSCIRTGLNPNFVLRISNLRIFDDDVAAHSQSIEESHGIGVLHSGGTTLIENILIENVGDEGVDVSTDQGRVVIRDSRFIDPRASAIAIYQCKSTLIENIQATSSPSNPGGFYAIDIDPGSQDWVVENVEIRNSSLLGKWQIGVSIRANPTGLPGTGVNNIAIQNNEIEIDPIASHCASGPSRCGSVSILSGNVDQYVRDVLIAHNQLQGAIRVDGDLVERVRIIDNTITPAPQAPDYGIRIRGLGSEVISNHVTGFKRGCIQFNSTPTNGGANSTIQLRISDNFLSCPGGDQDYIIGRVGTPPPPPSADDEGYFEITNNHINIPAESTIRYGIRVGIPFKNVRIRGNDIKRALSIASPNAYGIAASGNPLLVEENIIDGLWNGILVVGASHGRLAGNEIEIHNLVFGRGIDIYDSANVLVTENIVHGAGANGAAAVRTSGTGDRVICMNNISMGVGGVGPGGRFGCGNATSAVGLGCDSAGVGGESICDVNIIGN